MDHSRLDFHGSTGNRSVCGVLRLTDVLTKAGIPFAVCGGVAVAIHGYPRFTRDIDLLILGSDEQRVRDLTQGLGFIWKVDGCPSEQSRFGMGNRPSLEGDWTRCSGVGSAPGRSRHSIRLGQSACRRIQRASDLRCLAGGLRTLKRISGRKQDLIDIEQLGLEP